MFTKKYFPAFVCFVLLHLTAVAQIKFERDFNLAPALSGIRGWVEIGGKAYCSANDGYFGYELWQFDPATEQATRLTDLRKQGGSSDPADMTAYEGKVYFTATTDDGVRRLFFFNPAQWEVVEAGAPFVFDDDCQSNMVVHNGQLWLTGRYNGQLNLWKFDAASSVFTEIPTPANGHPVWFQPRRKTSFDGRLYFQAYHEDGEFRLWSYDNQTGGIIQEPTQFDGQEWEVMSSVVCGGKLFFFLEHGFKKRWHYYDPGADSCVLIYSPSMFGHDDFVCLDEKLWFQKVSGRGIEIYDPSNGQLTEIDESNTGGMPPYLGDFKIMDNQVWFIGNDPSIGILGVYQYNASAAQAELNTGFLSPYPALSSLMRQGDAYFGTANDGQQNEVFKYSPSSNTVSLVADINKGNANGFSLYEDPDLQLLDGRMYLSTSFSNNVNNEIWAKDLSDGHFENISEQLPMEDRPVIKHQAEVLDGRMYFSGAQRGNEFRQLVSYQTGDDTLTWHGNIQPTISLQGTLPYLRNMTAHNGLLYFNTWKDFVFTQFFRFDPASQTLDYVPGMEQTTGNMQFIFQDKLYFDGGLNGEFGDHLYAFDLVNGGYTEIANDSILQSSYPYSMYLLGDKIAFPAYNPSLFFSGFIRLFDPATGTYNDVLPQGYSRIYFKNPVLFEGKYWFNPEYYESDSLFWLDPATATCELALDLTPYGLVATGEMTVFDGKLYFAGATLEHGRELFEYDPVTAQVRLYADINPGAGNANPSGLQVINNRLYFIADDGWRGRELWSLSNCFAVSLTAVPDSLGQQAGQISLNVQGGTAPFSFSWNNGATTQDIAGLAAGFYEATVTDANGCEATVFTVLEGGLAVGINELAKTTQIKVFPNPVGTGQQLSISLENDFRGRVKIDFLGLDGRVLHSFFEEKTGQQLQVSKGLPSSFAGNLFIVRVSDGEGSAARVVVRF